MIRILFALIAFLAAPLFAAPPNVVFLLADDLRVDALGCYGNRLAHTPNIDALAREGVVFTRNFVTTSICSISRASILSGQYESRHGINDFTKKFTPAAWAETYPALMRAGGYQTGFIGKFGVGDVMPEKHFDFWKGFPGQGKYDAEGGHLTALMGAQALEFLQSTDEDKPFCLSISFKAPHAQDGASREFPPDPRDARLFENTRFPKAPTTDPEYFDKLPEFLKNSEGRVRWNRRFSSDQQYQQTTRDYFRLIAGMDREVGRIVDALKKRGVYQNTVIIFTSDNGFFLGERGMADKWLPYEESIRVPLIIRDPGARRKGAEESRMTLNIDLAPTLLAYARLAVPVGMQGESLLPLVRGQHPRMWRKDLFYEHHFNHPGIPQTEAVRNERWKYIRYIHANPVVEELYDLEKDPHEQRNVIAQRPGVAANMRDEWENYREAVKTGTATDLRR